MTERNPFELFGEAAKKSLSAHISDGQLGTMLRTAEEYHAEIERRVAAACQEAGLTPEKLLDYLNNPDNFTPEDWKESQKLRETLQKMTHERLSPKEKKPPHGGSGRRKNWIPMR